MNGKKMALIVGIGLYGLTAFGQLSYLYDSDGLRYDLGNASYSSYGNNIVAYNVQVTHYYYTNQTYGTAVIFYHSAYGYMKIFRVQQVVGDTYIYGIETMPRSSGTFGGIKGFGYNFTETIYLSFQPFHSIPSEQPVLDNALASGVESAPAQVGTLSADENISVDDDVYRFSALSSPHSFIFYVYTDVVLNYFPQSADGTAKALGMIVEIYYNTGNETHVYTTDGILYVFPTSSSGYRMYFTVFPSSMFQISFSILAYDFTVSDQNTLRNFTLAGDADFRMQFLGH